MALRSETELRAILGDFQGEYTTEAIEAAREEYLNRGLILDPGLVNVAGEAAASGAGKRVRFLGKWDLIVCAILSILGLASNRNPTLLTSSEAWVPYLIGRFVGILALWALLKGTFLFIRNFIRGLSSKQIRSQKSGK
jgi:hypothetical protein